MSPLHATGPAELSRPPRLMLRFALTIAAVFIVVVAGYFMYIRHQLNENAEGAAAQTAQFAERALLRRHLRASDFFAPVQAPRRAELDHIFESLPLAVQVKLFAPDGRLTYSNDHELIGRAGSTRPREVAAVLRAGSHQEVTWLGREGPATRDLKVLEAAVPVFLGHRRSPVGVFELYEDYGPVAQRVRSELTTIGVAGIVGGLLLVLALLPILRRVTATLRLGHEELEARTRELARRLVEREAVEADLRRAEERYRVLVERLPLVTYTRSIDPDAPTYISPQVEALLGYPVEDWLEHPWFASRLVHPDDREEMLAEKAKARSELKPYQGEYRLIARDGQVKWMHDEEVVVLDEAGSPLLRQGFALDVTVRKRAEEALRAEALRLSAIIATQVDIASFELDLDGLVPLIAVRTQGLTGGTGAAIELLEQGRLVTRWASGTAAPHVGMAVSVTSSLAGICARTSELLVCDDSELDPRVDLEACRKLGARSLVAVPLIRDSQTVGILNVYSDRPGAFGGRDVDTLRLMAGFLASAMDHAAAFEAKQALVSELEQAKEYSDMLIRTASVMIVGLDRQGEVVVFNEAAEAITGYARAELAGRGWFEAVMPREAYPESWADFEGWSAQGLPTAFEHPLRTKSGAERLVSWRTSEVCANGEVMGTLSFGIDVTDARSLEDQLRQAQKMEAIGRLAGGIAHDFNNLLTAINGYSALLLAGLEPDDPLRHDAEEIALAGDRAAGLTSQLLAFSRRQMLQTRLLDLNAVVHDVEAMLRRLIGEDIELVTFKAPDLNAVRADPGQLEQVLLNLAVNSRDAMPNGGRLTIATANVRLDEGDPALHPPMPPGLYVRVTVADTGHGMDEETMAQAFEPFFTTKEQGKGTGLGLSTVYGIVKQSGGFVWMESEPGSGTTVEIYLPHVEAPAEARPAEPRQTGAAGGSETILLIEDEDGVRGLAREVLERSGYTVLEAPGARRALEISEVHAGPIHLLLTDVVMPEMNGPEVAELLVARSPETRVLFTSGYTAEAILRRGRGTETPVLPKPFTPASLVGKVREVLDKALADTA